MTTQNVPNESMRGSLLPCFANATLMQGCRLPRATNFTIFEVVQGGLLTVKFAIHVFGCLMLKWSAESRGARRHSYRRFAQRDRYKVHSIRSAIVIGFKKPYVAGLHVVEIEASRRFY